MTESSSPAQAEVYIPLPFDVTNPAHVELIRRIIPDMRKVEYFVNPIHQVMFRAGMLVMRELVIDELLHTYESKSALRSRIITELKPFIGNVWPADWLGDDPGTPRFIDWSTAKEQIGEGEWADVEPTPSQEALGDAFDFLKMIGVMSDEADNR